MSVTSDWSLNYKTSMDPDALVYIFEDRDPIAVDRGWMNRIFVETDSNGNQVDIPTYYASIVSPAMSKSIPTAIYYKTAQTKTIGAHAMTFDGNLEWFSLDAGTFSNEFTVGTWINTSSLNVNILKVAGISFDIINGQFQVTWKNITGGYVYATINGLLLNDGKWHYIQAIFNNLQVYISADESLFTTTNPGIDYSSLSSAPANVLVGKNDWDYGKMMLDNLSIYKIALPQNSGAIIYQHPFTYLHNNDSQDISYPDILIRFDITNGTVLKDFSGNNTPIGYTNPPTDTIAASAVNIWVDLRKVRVAYPNLGDGVFILLNDYNNPGFASAFSFDSSILPRVSYTDGNGYLYEIAPGDGMVFPNIAQTLYIDERDDTKVLIEQANYSQPSLGTSSTPSATLELMTDLVITSLDKTLTAQNVLGWVNGFFFPPIPDPNNVNRFFFINSLGYLDVYTVDQPSYAPMAFNELMGFRPKCTVTEQSLYNIYRYNFQVRLFSWNGVNFSGYSGVTYHSDDILYFKPPTLPGVGVPTVSSPNQLVAGDFSTQWGISLSNTSAQLLSYDTGASVGLPAVANIPGYGNAVFVLQNSGINGGFYGNILSPQFIQVTPATPKIFSIYVRAMYCKVQAVAIFFTADPLSGGVEVAEVPFETSDDYYDPLFNTEHPGLSPTDPLWYKRLILHTPVPSNATVVKIAVRKFETSVPPQGVSAVGFSGVYAMAAMVQDDPSNDGYVLDWVPPVTTTTYTWVKYATNDQGAQLTDDPEGMSFVGYAFNKTTPVESTTPTDYTWYAYTELSVRIPKDLYFINAIDPQAHLIMGDGRVLAEDEYTLDPANPSHITLNSVFNEAQEFYRKALLHYHMYAQTVSIGGSPNMNGYPYWPNPVLGQENLPAYEATLKRYAYIRYSAVNLVSTTPGKNLRVIRKPGCVVNFPLPNEVTFDDMGIADVVLVNGYFIPYEYMDEKTIRFPNSLLTMKYLRGRRLEDSDVYRMQIVQTN